jgi:hypothetical protein
MHDARQRATDLIEELVDHGAIELIEGANRAALAANLAELLAVPLDPEAMLDWVEGWLFAQDEVAEVYATRRELAALLGARRELDN